MIIPPGEKNIRARFSLRILRKSLFAIRYSMRETQIFFIVGLGNEVVRSDLKPLDDIRRIAIGWSQE